MTRLLAPGMALFALAVTVLPADADVVIQYQHQSRNSSLSITFSSGSSYSSGSFGNPYSYPSYGFGGSSIFVANGGSFTSYNGYLLPGVYYPSPFGSHPPYYDDPLGFGYSARPSRRNRRGDVYDEGTFDAESLRRKYYGVEGEDSYIPGGGEGTVAARLARTESVRGGLEAFHGGRYAEAMLTLRDAYLRDMKDPGTKIFYGLSLIPLGEYDLAEKAIRRGIEDSASKSDWLVEVPKVYGIERDYQQHKLLLQHRRDQADPRHAAFLLTYLMAAEGQWAEAQKYLDLLGEKPGRAADALRALIESHLQK